MYIRMSSDPHRTVPLAVLTVDDAGEPSIDQTAVLSDREATVAIDTSKPFKINAGTYGVCMYCTFFFLDHIFHGYVDRVLYTEERLIRIAREAAKNDIIFSLNDRIGLVHDAMALAKSGHASVSSALTVVDIFGNETECKYFCL